MKMGGRYLRLAYYASHWVPESGRPASRRFMKRFGAMKPNSPDFALAYDAVMLLADAIGRAGSSDPAKIRRALAATKGFEGVTGAISFDEYGDPIKGAVIMRIQNGVYGFYQDVQPR